MRVRSLGPLGANVSGLFELVSSTRLGDDLVLTCGHQTTRRTREGQVVWSVEHVEPEAVKAVPSKGVHRARCHVARGERLWVAAGLGVSCYGADGNQLASSGQLECLPSLLALSPDGSFLLAAGQLPEPDGRVALRLDSTSLAHAKPMAREPGKKVTWTTCFESGGTTWLGGEFNYRSVDWAGAALGRELSWQPRPNTRSIPEARPPLGLKFATLRSPPGSEPLLLVFAHLPKAREGRYLTLLWTFPVAESEDHAAGAWKPQPAIIRELPVRRLTDIAFSEDGERLLLAHYRRLSVHDRSGKEQETLELDFDPLRIHAVGADEYVVGSRDGIAWLVETSG